MQRNVSPLTAIIVVLVALAIAALAWVRLSTGPKPLTGQDRAARQSAGSRRGSTTSTGRRGGRGGGGRRGGGGGGGRRGGRGGGRRGGSSATEAQPAAAERQTEAPAAPAEK
jgi:hypothetical protein